MTASTQPKEHGYEAEDRLELVCSRIFGPDLVARSPVLHEASGEKELSDLLIPFHDHLVVIQSKSIDLEAAEIDDVKQGRVNKKIEKAISQFSTTLNARARKAKVVFKNQLGFASEVDWEEHTNLVGVITINLSDRDFSDPEYRYSMPLVIEEFKGLRIHIFVLRDLWHVAEDITTPMDFLDYVKQRERASSSDKFWFGNELDFLAFIKTRHDWYSEVLAGTHEANRMMIAPGLWEDYRTNPQRLYGMERNFKYSAIYDAFVKELKTSVQHSIEQYGTSQERAIKDYFSLAGALSNTRRVERRELGMKILEKLENTKTRPVSYFIQILPDADLTLVYIACNEEDPEIRINILENFGCSASHIARTHFVLGILTEGLNCRVSNFNFLFAPTEELRSEPNFVHPSKLFGSLQESTFQEWDEP